MLLVLFRHNKTPKVFCLTFGVQVRLPVLRFFVIGRIRKSLGDISKAFAVRTGLEPATPGVTGRYSNQLNYRTNVQTFHQISLKWAANIGFFLKTTILF